MTPALGLVSETSTFEVGIEALIHISGIKLVVEGLRHLSAPNHEPL